jgi:hypothetical protein
MGQVRSGKQLAIGAGIGIRRAQDEARGIIGVDHLEDDLLLLREMGGDLLPQGALLIQCLAEADAPEKGEREKEDSGGHGHHPPGDYRHGRGSPSFRKIIDAFDGRCSHVGTHVRHCRRGCQRRFLGDAQYSILEVGRRPQGGCRGER